MKNNYFIYICMLLLIGACKKSSDLYSTQSELQVKVVEKNGEKFLEWNQISSKAFVRYEIYNSDSTYVGIINNNTAMVDSITSSSKVNYLLPIISVINKNKIVKASYYTVVADLGDRKIKSQPVYHKTKLVYNTIGYKYSNYNIESNELYLENVNKFLKLNIVTNAVIEKAPSNPNASVFYEIGKDNMGQDIVVYSSNYYIYILDKELHGVSTFYNNTLGNFKIINGKLISLTYVSGNIPVLFSFDLASQATTDSITLPYLISALYCNNNSIVLSFSNYFQRLNLNASGKFDTIVYLKTKLDNYSIIGSDNTNTKFYSATSVFDDKLVKKASINPNVNGSFSANNTNTMYSFTSNNLIENFDMNTNQKLNTIIPFKEPFSNQLSNFESIWVGNKQYYCFNSFGFGSSNTQQFFLFEL